MSGNAISEISRTPFLCWAKGTGVLLEAWGGSADIARVRRIVIACGSVGLTGFMKNDPHTPLANTTKEQLIGQCMPVRHKVGTAALALLVKRHGYRNACTITGYSRGSVWARLRPEQAKVPRGKRAVKTVEVKWHLEYTPAANAPSEFGIVTTLRRNLRAYLARAERIGDLSSIRSHRVKTAGAHIKRITSSLTRLALLHLCHAERAVQNVPWATLSPEHVVHVSLCVRNIQERIVQVLALMLLRRDTKAYKEIPRIYRSNRVAITICAQTFAIENPVPPKKMTYTKIAATSDRNREQIKKIETEAFRKLKPLLKPEWEDLMAYLS